MSTVGKTIWRGGLFMGAVVPLTSAMLMVLNSASQGPTTLGDGAGAIESLAKAADFRAVLPANHSGRRAARFVLFLVEPAEPGGTESPDGLGAPQILPQVAEGLGAVMLFGSARTDAAGKVNIEPVQNLLRRLLGQTGPDRPVVTVVGHKAGVRAALELFARETGLTDALVLVGPVLPQAAGQMTLAKSSSDARPVLLLAAAPPAADSVKAALRERFAKADIIECGVEKADPFPINHLATFLAWSNGAAALKRAPIWLTSGATPASGSARVWALESLIDCRDYARRAQEGLTAPVTIEQPAGSPKVEPDGPFFAELADRTRRLAALGQDIAAKVEKRLTQAEAQAEAQVPVILNSIKAAPMDRQEAIRKRFLEENFPWPDLLSRAPKVAQVSRQEFLAVMQAKCVRCHKACATVEDQVAKRWIRPGNPQASPTFTCLGVHKNKGATYHNVSDKEKQIIHDFIKQLP